MLHALGMFVPALLKSRLEAENLLLRHQLTIATYEAPAAERAPARTTPFCYSDEGNGEGAA